MQFSKKLSIKQNYYKERPKDFAWMGPFLDSFQGQSRPEQMAQFIHYDNRPYVVATYPWHLVYLHRLRYDHLLTPGLPDLKLLLIMVWLWPRIYGTHVKTLKTLIRLFRKWFFVLWIFLANGELDVTNCKHMPAYYPCAIRFCLISIQYILKNDLHEGQPVCARVVLLICCH